MGRRECCCIFSFEGIKYDTCAVPGSIYFFVQIFWLICWDDEGLNSARQCQRTSHVIRLQKVHLPRILFMTDGIPTILHPAGELGKLVGHLHRGRQLHRTRPIEKFKSQHVDKRIEWTD